jgi:hypothetical protein
VQKGKVGRHEQQHDPIRTDGPFPLELFATSLDGEPPQAAAGHRGDELYPLPDPGIDEDDSVLWLDGKPIVYSLMGGDREKDRRTLRRYVGSVTITKSKRGRWEAISDRIAVTWVDGSEPQIPGAAG